MLKFYGTQKSTVPSEYQALDMVPSALMCCDLPDFKITYANPYSMALLRQIEQDLPVPADEIVGNSIDIFHKNPAHQRALLSDPSNLPHRARIEVGANVLELEIVARIARDGKYLGPLLLWNVVTEKVAAERQANQLTQMIDQMPINCMFMEIDTFKIAYMNAKSMETLKSLEHLLPFKAEEVRGQCVDVFHKNPAHQRKLLADPSNLPHRAKIKLGEETLDLRASAVNNRNGDYIGVMVTWAVVTAQISLTEEITRAVSTVSSASTQMKSAAEVMSANAEETNAQSNAVAAATEELTASINEISSQATRSAGSATQAVEQVERSNAMISSLAESAHHIGQVLDLISDIAGQTNLLVARFNQFERIV